MIEILAPAASPDGLRAAVQNGADAVYLGLRGFNARRGAKNFTRDEFKAGAEYCRVRGAKVYVALNTLITDREFNTAIEVAKEAARLGADAMIVTDLGLIRALRDALPDTPLHASTQMSIHSLEGAKLAAAMGLRRVILARELPREEIEYITQTAPVETEVFVHGALCMSYSGQCYFSAVLGRRSGNRGMCAQPCRLPFGGGAKGDDYPLSLKDNCLIEYVTELERAGVKCIKIEGRMKRPEYAAIVTRVYSRIAKERREPTAAEMEELRSAFRPLSGSTNGYYVKNIGRDMFGVRGDERADDETLRAVRRAYTNQEIRRVPVRFIAAVKADIPARLIARDDRKNTAAAQAGVPEPAYYDGITTAELSTQLHKTGGAPFYCNRVKCFVDPGLHLPVKEINEMRRSVLAQLMEMRKRYTPPVIDDYMPEFREYGNVAPPVFTVSVTSAGQLSRELLEMKPSVVYIPAEELGNKAAVRPFLQSEDITVAVALPRVTFSEDMPRLSAILDAANRAGIKDALCTNLGHVPVVLSHGMNPRGDFGLNIFNSASMRAAREFGLKSATLSFELNAAQIGEISKTIDAEIIAYGRLPLMLTENCVIKLVSGVCSCGSFKGLEDKRGVTFPVIRESGCRNVVLNSMKLFLADRLEEFTDLGLWALRLCFTTENARECAAVLRRYMGEGDFAPGGYTRGLYFRGVE